MRHRNRIMLTFLLLLAGGAIINVAVAWGCALCADPYQLKPTRQAASDQPNRIATLVVLHRRAFGSGVYRIFSSAGTNLPQLYDAPPIRDVVPPWVDPGERPVDADVVHDGRGWPMISMHYAMQMTNWPSTNTMIVRGGWELQSAAPIQVGSQAIPRVLPLRPFWPGFAINTVLSAAILWLLFVAPFAFRRRRRSKRGLCPTCAYDLRNRPGDSSACPECGSPRQTSP